MTVTTVGALDMFVGQRKSSGIDTDESLLPCPFCGHPAGFHDANDRGDHHPWRVVCINTSCGVATPKHYQSRETAAAAWNRRAPSAAAGQS
jgi:Lar family restriction alleviation protein